MTKQYKLTVSPSCNGYGDIEKSPVVLSAQISLDLANLVGSKAAYPENPILVEATEKLEAAIEKSNEIGGYLDGKERDFLNAARSYVNAINSKNNDQTTYENLINYLQAMTPIEDAMA
jgi:hypothetical protein